MLEAIGKLMEALPTINGKKDPTLACLIGFFAGGIGLGIYFQSVVDLIVQHYFCKNGMVSPGVARPLDF